MTLPILAVLPYALAALSMGACVWIFILLKIEMRKEALRSRKERQRLEDELTGLRTALDAITQRLDEAPLSTTPAAPALAPGLSLNIAHRAQALRMSRRGERPDQIAAALGIPRAEVELLLKIHQASLAAATG